LDILILVGSSFGIILFGVLLPYLLPLENLPEVILSETRSYLKTALPIAVIGLILSLIYIIVTRYFENIQERFFDKSKQTSSILLKIITYDFIFEFSTVFYLRVIKPTAIWFKENVIIGFFIGIISHYTYLWTRLLFRGLKKLIADIIIPAIKKTFVKVSSFLRGLEGYSLKRQLHLAALFLLIILVTVIAYYYGGNVR
jgi:hypothetical protein